MSEDTKWYLPEGVAETLTTWSNPIRLSKDAPKYMIILRPDDSDK